MLDRIDIHIEVPCVSPLQKPFLTTKDTKFTKEIQKRKIFLQWSHVWIMKSWVEIEWGKTGESIRKRVQVAHNIRYRHNRWLVIEGGGNVVGCNLAILPDKEIPSLE
jgi:hypothetical protein